VGQVGPQQLDYDDSLESRIKRFPLDRIVADPQLTRELIALGDERNARARLARPAWHSTTVQAARRSLGSCT
jgi:hypothetical protein